MMANIVKRASETIKGSKVWIVGVFLLIVLVVGYVMTNAPEVEIPRSQVAPGSAMNTVPVQGQAQNTQAYNNELDVDDNNRLENAVTTGGSALPTLRPNPTQTDTPIFVAEPPPVAPPEIATPEPSINQQPILIQAPVNNGVPIVAPPNASRAADTKARADALFKDMAAMNRTIPTALRYDFGNPSDFVVAEAEQSASVAQTSNETGEAGSKIKLPLSGKILYAELVGRANSDVPGPVLAKVLQGPYRGATLIGSFKTARSHLIITFDKMTVETDANGEEINETVAIDAVAVDTSNIGTGLATSVDRHLFQKLAIGFTSAFAQGFGEAISDRGSTTYNTSNGTITTRNGDLNAEEELYSAGGKAVGRAGSVLENEFGNRPTTIIVEGGTAIGVLFL